MWRVLAEPIAFFLLPFVAYALYLIARKRYPFVRAHWPNAHVSILALIGIIAAVLSVFVFGFSAKRYSGHYAPAHMENGKLVPGKIE